MTVMKIYPLGLAALVLICSVLPAEAQEKVIVAHSARAALSIGPLLYGIERGFYRDEGIDLIYVSIRADLGIKALLSGDIDYSYSTGTIHPRRNYWRAGKKSILRLLARATRFNVPTGNSQRSCAQGGKSRRKLLRRNRRSCGPGGIALPRARPRKRRNNYYFRQ